MDTVDLTADPDWNCQVHNRSLTYPEWKAGVCFWCHPERMPKIEPGKDGKLTASQTVRQKAYENIAAVYGRGQQNG